MSAPSTILDWLLEPDEPSVRYGALVDLMDEPAASPRARRARGAIRRSARAQALLAGQQEDGSFGCHPYSKWRGSHWRLLRLADLDYPPRGRALKRAIDNALPWLLSHQPPILNGRARRCGSQQGAAVLYCTRLGYGDDPRVRALVDRLIEWQWPDGGWNCDKRPEAGHSSFHETWLPLWGLTEYWHLTGDACVKGAVDRAAELLLRHRLFRRDHASDQVIIRQGFVQLLYPAYWHYQILDACRALDAAGKLGDPRASEALDLIASKQRPDGTWAPERSASTMPTSKPRSGVDVVRWTRKGQPCKFLTLNAMRVLRKAGRM
jgi:hypothetical protein